MASPGRSAPLVTPLFVPVSRSSRQGQDVKVTGVKKRVCVCCSRVVCLCLSRSLYDEVAVNARSQSHQIYDVFGSLADKHVVRQQAQFLLDSQRNLKPTQLP